MILNTSFFQPTSNAYSIAFSATSATITIPTSNVVFNNLRITNSSGNVCFMQVSTTDPGNIAHPTNGANGSSNVFAVPTGQTSFISTGITSPGNVYVSTISISGTGAVGIQTGSFI